ncbi:hypothetical protein KKD81_02920, partial [Patescibacteria group bacterium]|nr:hypothetical protein [Patescibacteria group bacterium]
EEEPVEVVQDQRNDVTQTWKKPEYASMEPVTVPEFAQKQPEKLEESKAVADMQNAWKEWFQEKKALPDGSDDFREEYLPVEVKEEVNTPSESSDEPVSISRIREEEPVMEANDENEEEVQLHKSYDSVRSGEVVPATNVPVVNLRAADTTLKEEKLAKSASSKGNLVVQSTIVAVTILVVLVSLIGTGSADALLSGTSLNAGPQKAVTDYLGGTRTLNK